MRLLLVDDSEGTLVTLGDRIALELGVDVVTANGAEEALELLRRGERFNCIVTDICMYEGAGDGLLVIRRFHEANPDCPIVALTGFDEYKDEMEKDVKHNGAIALERKNDDEHLMTTLSGCMGVVWTPPSSEV